MTKKKTLKKILLSSAMALATLCMTVGVLLATTLKVSAASQVFDVSPAMLAITQKNMVTGCIVLGVILVCELIAIAVIAIRRRLKDEQNTPVAEEVEAPAEEPVEEIVEETVDEPVEAPVEETAEEADEDNVEVAHAFLVNGKEVLVRYNRSFRAKLIQSKDTTKDFYAELHNYIMSYTKVRNRESWSYSSYIVGRQKVLVLNVRGKTLYMYAALGENDAENVKYPTEMTDTKRYAATPLLIKVRSPRGLDAAKRMVDMVMANVGQTVAECPTPIAAADYPYEETETLIDKGLIKVIALDGEEINENSELVVAKFSVEQREKISVDEASHLMSDAEAAAMLLPDEERYGVAGKKVAINIDTLSDNFENDDIVNIETLKAKGLVPKSATAIKILARGFLDKQLTVEAEDFSADAVKMIVLVGGSAYKLRIPKE